MDEMEIVLIEDNDEDANNLIQFVRANFSNRVRLFQDGADAAEYLLFNADSIPRLILLDVVLPSIDGIELFRIIKAEPEDRKFTVVFLVSSLSSKEYIESLGLHPDGFLKKPRGVMPPCRI
jgi:DNA-binding response OmpR family regulator